MARSRLGKVERSTAEDVRFQGADGVRLFGWYIGSRFTLIQNWTVRLEYNHRNHDNDVLFSLQAFF